MARMVLPVRRGRPALLVRLEPLVQPDPRVLRALEWMVRTAKTAHPSPVLPVRLVVRGLLGRLVHRGRLGSAWTVNRARWAFPSRVRLARWVLAAWP